MYFKKLSLETLNESDAWDMVKIGSHYVPKEYAVSDPIKLPDVGKIISKSIGINGQEDGSRFRNAYNLLNNNSAADNFNPDLSTSTSSISDTFSNSWDKFINYVESLYTNAKISGAQFIADHQSGLNRAGGFFTGVLSKSLFDYVKNWLFPPEVQNVAQDSNKMSALASAGVGAAATAGVLGLIWLFKKWKNKGQVTNQDIQYAARLNQMKPEDIPEEDKNKPIEA